jgi:hypothetical protein
MANVTHLLESKTIGTIEAKLAKHWHSVFGLRHVNGRCSKPVERHECNAAFDIVLPHPIQNLSDGIVIIYYDLKKAGRAENQSTPPV